MEWIASLISEQKCSIINSVVLNGWKCMRNAFVRRELKVLFNILKGYVLLSEWIMHHWKNIIWTTNIYLPHEVYHLTIFKPVCFGWLVMESLKLQGSTQSHNFRLRTVLPFANPGCCLHVIFEVEIKVLHTSVQSR